MSSSTEGVYFANLIHSDNDTVWTVVLPPLFNYLKNALSGRFCVQPIHRAAAAAFIYEIKDN